MLRDLEYVKETIDLRKDEIRSNEFETNDLLMEDILRALGYNRKRDTGVKAIYSNEANWQVAINGEPRFIVYVYGYECEDSIEVVPNSAIQFADDNGYNYIITTDGKRLVVSNLTKKLVSINDIFNLSESEEILTLISKDGWDTTKLEEIGNKVNIDTNTVIELINSKDTAEFVLNTLGIDITDNSIQAILDIIKTNSTNSNDNTSENSSQTLNNELEGLKSELEKRESQLKSKEIAFSDREKELTSRETSISERERQLDEKEEQIVSREHQLEVEKLSTNKDTETIQSEIGILQSQKAQIQSEVDSLETRKESAQQALDEMSNQIAEMRQKAGAINTEIAGLESKKETVQNDLVQLQAKKDELDQFDMIDDTDTSEEVQKLKDENNELKSEIKRLKDTNSQNNTSSAADDNEQIHQLQSLVDSLREENEQLKKSPKDDLYKDLKFETEGAYREKIAQMTAEIQQIKTISQGYKDQLDEIERIKAGAEDERIVLGRTLLEAVEDNPDLSRTYVGVVDSKLFQITDITKFVGTCLQELYNVVQFDLMQILFDGDVFKIIQPATRCDLMINTKQYDIDLRGFSESDIINRIKAVFNKFPNVVFMCKTIGKMDEAAFKKQLEYTNASTQVDAENQFNNTGIQWDEVDSGDSQESEWRDPSLVDQSSIDQGSQYQDIDGINDTTQQVNTPSNYLGASFSDALTVVGDPNTPVYNISAIGDNTRLFKIKNETFFDIITCGIESLLAMLQSTLNGALNLRNNDLTLINNKIVHYENAIDTSIPVPFTTEFFVNVESVYDCVDVIVSLARMLGFMDAQLFFYFSANYFEGTQYETMFIQGDQLNLERHINYDEIAPVKQVINCMISGEYIATLMYIPESKFILDKMINTSMAFRRAPHGKGSSFKTMQDLGNFIALKIDEASGTITPDQIIESINNQMYSTIISTTNEDFSNESVEIKLKDETIYYMDKHSGYECMMILMALNRVLCNDDSIEIRLDLNSSVYTLFKNGTDMSDCGEFVAGKMFLECIEGKTKVIS